MTRSVLARPVTAEMLDWLALLQRPAFQVGAKHGRRNGSNRAMLHRVGDLTIRPAGAGVHFSA